MITYIKMSTDDKEIQVLINLYNDRSQLANQHTNLWMEGIKFYFTLIIATITIPIALKQLGFNNKIFLTLFSIVGIFFCIAGIWSLIREAKAFQRALYSISKIREELLKYCPTFMSSINNNPESIGIYHIDFNRFPNLDCYLTHRLHRISSNDTLFSLIYVIFIIFHMLLIIFLY